MTQKGSNYLLVSASCNSLMLHLAVPFLYKGAYRSYLFEKQIWSAPNN